MTAGSIGKLESLGLGTAVGELRDGRSRGDDGKKGDEKGTEDDNAPDGAGGKIAGAVVRRMLPGGVEPVG